MENLNLAAKYDMKKEYGNMQIALLFFVVSKILFYQSISYAHSTKYIFLISITLIASFSAEILFGFITKKDNEKYDPKSCLNYYPQITALVISCFINFGYHTLVVFICTFFSVFFIKNLFGNFSYNILNAPAFCMILMYTCSPYMVSTSSMNGNIDRFFLSIFNAKNTNHISQMHNLKNAIFSDQLPYISNITLIIFLLTILYFFISLKIIKKTVSMPAIILMFLFIISFSFIGFLNGTSHLQPNILQFNGLLRYIITLSGSLGHIFKTMLLLVYIIIGPTIIAIILCTSYTVNIPKNRSNKYIVGFFIAFVVFYTKTFTNNPFGIFYAIVISNGCTPMLDNILNPSKNKEHAIFISLTMISLIIGFLAFSFAMKGV